MGFRLSAHFPDEFFALQDSGSVRFALDSGYLPHHHTEPRIKACRIVVQTETGVSAQDLVITLSALAQGVTVDQTTDSRGMIATGSAAVPLNAVRGSLLEDTWTPLFRPG